MISNVLFFLIICSGSFFCTAKFSKKFEEILPITCMSIGAILFLFGIIGFLKAGVYVIAASAILFYLLSMLEIWKKRKCFLNFVKHFFTVGFVFFAAVFFILSIVLYDQMASHWDEFSHWMDIVKVMTMLDDFATNAESYSMFKSYPPAMALFQYMFQKIYLMVKPEQVFCEWRAYLAYQLYFVAVLLPSFKNLNHRQYLKMFSLSLIISIVPSIFYNNIYSSLYIDPFLGILSAAGFANIICYNREDKDIFYSIYICLIIFTLVLSKDAGIIFAVFLAIFYVVDYNLGENLFVNKRIKKIIILQTFFVITAVFIPKILWKWKLTISEAKVSFQTNLNFNTLVNILMGKDDSYRSEVLKNYVYALFDQNIVLGYTNIQINYFVLYLIMAVALYAILKKFVINKMISKKQAVIYYLFPIVQLTIYVLGMCIIYMFNFTEYEALKLASFGRYINIAFLTTSILIFMLIWKYISNISVKDPKTYQMIFIVFLMAISPMKEIVEVFDSSNVENAASWRSGYDKITNNIMSVCDGDDTVYIIAQEDKGIERLVLKYNIRPNKINIDNYTGWSIGKPFYEGDIWTVEKEAEEWRKELIESYDYVALSWLNDYFYDNFSVLFEDPNSIEVDGVYKVDKVRGTLVRVK